MRSYLKDQRQIFEILLSKIVRTNFGKYKFSSTEEEGHFAILSYLPNTRVALPKRPYLEFK